MKPIALISILLCAGSNLLGQQKPETASTQLAEMLEAKAGDGQSVIAPGERTYFQGLNDHLKELLSAAIENKVITEPEHLGLILSLGLQPQKMELLLQDNCLLCHTDSESQSPEELFSVDPAANGTAVHLNLKHWVEDAHFQRGLSCAGCHGGDPRAESGHEFVKEWPAEGRETNRAWVVYFCARCHSDSAFMNGFNPGLPTDQLAKFKESRHGKALLESSDSRAAQCVSCHDVHGILPAKNPRSKVHAKRIPETCGACHADPKRMSGFKRPDGSPLPTNQLEQYRASVHGMALARGDLGAPACNDCHGNHGPRPPEISEISRSCSLCHSANAALFEGSKHRLAFAKHNWSECGQCHSNHAIGKPSDSMLGSGPQSWCADCHRQFSKDNPECDAVAEYFYKTITALDRGFRQFSAASEELAAKGLDVEPLDNQLKQLSDDLKKSRAHIHSFSRSAFAQVSLPGEQALQELANLDKKARGEYRSRQAGLLGSIGLIGLLMLALYLKLRQLEK